MEAASDGGMGSALWAEIKRRHNRGLRADTDVDERSDASEIALAAVPEPELPPAAVGDAAEIRAELAEARADLAHLQEMLADAKIALAALTAEAEAAGEQSADELPG